MKDFSLFFFHHNLTFEEINPIQHQISMSLGAFVIFI